MSKGKLTPEDLRLWSGQLKGVKPLSKSKKKPEVPEPKTVKPKKAIVERPLRKPKDADISEPFQRRKLRNIQFEAQVDLHGMSLNQGYEALERFLRRAQDKGLRIVLVITGKGALNNENTLKHQLPRWLEETPLRHLISAYSHPAKPNHGGAGATYVRVRKKKPALRSHGVLAIP